MIKKALHWNRAGPAPGRHRVGIEREPGRHRVGLDRAGTEREPSRHRAGLNRAGLYHGNRAGHPLLSMSTSSRPAAVRTLSRPRIGPPAEGGGRGGQW